MGLFSSTRLDSMEDLLVEQMQDLYDAEQRLVKALPKMASAAHNSSLKSAFQEHLKQTQNHVSRLERAFGMLGRKAESKTCQAMKGLVEEGDEVAGMSGDDDVLDAAIIAAAQRVEHYEMAAYGSARTFAQRVGRNDVAGLLQETLREEEATDKKLTQLAESSVNARAAAR